MQNTMNLDTVSSATGAAPTSARARTSASEFAATIAISAAASAVLLVCTGSDVLAAASGSGAAVAVSCAVTLPRLVPAAARGVSLAALAIAAVLLVPAGRVGGLVPVLLALSVLLAASVTQPRRLALAGVLVVAAATAAGAALGATPAAWVVGAVVFGLGAATVHVVTALLRARDELALRTESVRQGHSSLGGQTRVELGRIQQELDVMRNQLRREAHSREEAEAQLLAAFRTKEAFLATICQELGTPLEEIIGYSELLMEDTEVSDPTQLVGDVERIHQAAMNLFDIIGNVLDQSRIDAGKVDLRLEPVELYRFVEKLGHVFAVTARRRNNTLRLRCPEDIGVIVTDPGKLHTILRNLLNNACRFTEGGTIRIAVELDSTGKVPTYVFKISDTGPGLRQEQIERMFHSHETAEVTRARRTDGAGLGLAVSRQFCAMLGGELTAESALGSGSTFTVRLPREWNDPRASGALVLSVGA